MSAKFTDLHCKEVICISDGRRLGYISDARIELPEGNITAIIVPGPGRYLGCFGREFEFCIPWCDIIKIGPDIVLVNLKEEMRHKI